MIKLKFSLPELGEDSGKGFMMPAIIVMIAVLGLVGFATALGAQNTFNTAVRGSFNQIAKTAARSGIDFAKEQYDIDSNYGGTAETELYANESYRVTFEVIVLETQYEFKRIQSIGRLYIPEISAVTEFTRNIEAGIIRESAGSGSPLDYDPLVWFDASDENTLLSSTGSGGGGAPTGSCSQTAKFLYEKYDGISGSSISNLTSDSDYPNNPNSTQELTGDFVSPVNVDNSYGVRMSAQICAPQSGMYTFWVAGNNNVELWLSTDTDPANKTRIAYHTNYTNVEQWDKYSSQESNQIALTENTQYYIEVLMKENTASDHVQVGWQLPDTTMERPIAAAHLSLPSEFSNQYNDVSLLTAWGSSAGQVVEERGSDATNNPGNLIWGSDDIEMSWDGSAKGHQWAGLRFIDSGIPQGATITQAYLQFTTDQTKSSGNVSLEIYGRDEDNPGAWSGNSAVSNAPKTSASVTWTPQDWNVAGESGTKQQTPDLKDIVQEIVDRPSFAEDDIAFMIGYNSGSGVRTAEKGKNGDHPQLYVQWEASGSTSGGSGGGGGGSGGGGGATIAGDGDRIVQWLDKSGNGHHANLILGAGATREDGELNDRPVVHFVAADTNAYRADFPDVTSNTMTAFVVLRFNVTSSWDARVISLMDNNATDDWNTTNGVYLMQRDDTTTGVRTRHNNDVCVTATQTVVGQFAIFGVHVPAGGSNAEIRLNQVGGYSDPTGCPGFNPTSLNELWFGGRRGGNSMSCVGPNVPIWQGGIKYCQFLDGDIAEYLIFDGPMNESQMADVEYYLSKKWDIELSPVSGS